jgi:hypothetical protein
MKMKEREVPTKALLDTKKKVGKKGISKASNTVTKKKRKKE